MAYTGTSSARRVGGAGFRSCLGRGQQSAHKRAGGDNDPLERVETFIRNFVDRRPGLPGGCPLLNTAIDADDGNRALRTRARQALHEWYGRLIELLNQARNNGLLRAEADPSTLAVVIISTLEGAVMFSRLEGDRAALGHARDHLLNHLTSLRAVKRARTA